MGRYGNDLPALLERICHPQAGDFAVRTGKTGNASFLAAAGKAGDARNFAAKSARDMG